MSSAWRFICSILASIDFGSPAPSTKVVSSFDAIAFRACPRSSIVADSNPLPVSFEIRFAPNNIARSSSIALRRSPKPGALIAKQFIVPLSLLTTNVASASFSMSSAIITMSLLVADNASKIGTSSFAADIFSEVNKI